MMRRWRPANGLASETPESILIRHEENSMMHLLVEGLLRLFREALILRDVEDMSYRQIADITGLPACTMIPHLVHAPVLAAAAWSRAQMRPREEMLT
jgi:DNA-directed RNA polymerase specialized sigma24 family protein